MNINFLKEERGQGSTEYLLILTGGFVVIAVALVFLTDFGDNSKNIAENREKELWNEVN